MLNKFWPRQYFSYPSIELSFDLCFCMYLYLCICICVFVSKLQMIFYRASSSSGPLSTASTWRQNLNAQEVFVFLCKYVFGKQGKKDRICNYVFGKQEKRQNLNAQEVLSFFVNVSSENKGRERRQNLNAQEVFVCL